MNWRATSSREIAETNRLLSHYAPLEYLPIMTRDARLTVKVNNFNAWRVMHSERDATRRSFRWMRQLRKAGADFSYQEPITQGEISMLLRGHEHLTDFMRKGTANYQELARAALATYDASNYRLHQSYRNMGADAGKSRLHPYDVEALKESRRQRERLRRRS